MRSSGWRSNTAPKINMPMMSWLPRMIVMNVLSFGPRTLPEYGASVPLVRMWNDGGSPRSTTASQNSSYIGSS